eukprot:gene851-9100_t
MILICTTQSQVSYSDGKYDFTLLNLSPLHFVAGSDEYLPYHLVTGNKRFKCFIPKVKISEKSEEKVQSDEEEIEQAKNSLLPLLKNCYYRMEGWWIYEVCPGKRLRQYHQENGKVEKEYILGMKTDENSMKVFIDSEDPSNSHVSLTLTNGTRCDLPTHKKPREVEIKIYCSENIKAKFTDGAIGHDHFVGEVSEPSSCGYVVKFYTKSLCQQSKFRGKKEKVNLIKCYIDPKKSSSNTRAKIDFTGASSIQNQ